MRTSTLTFMLCHLEYIPKSAMLSLHCRKRSHKLIAARLLNVIIISEIIVGIIIVIVAATAITNSTANPKTLPLRSRTE